MKNNTTMIEVKNNTFNPQKAVADSYDDFIKQHPKPSETEIEKWLTEEVSPFIGSRKDLRFDISDIRRCAYDQNPSLKRPKKKCLWNRFLDRLSFPE